MAKTLKLLKKINKFLNNLFIKAILVIFYLFIIGFGKFVFLFIKQKQSDKSYWRKPNKTSIDLELAY